MLARDSDDEQDLISNSYPAAWIDSDDERIVVSLASNSRLRKLRITESEDLVNGKEYTKRLRRQFERLYPVPEWANPSVTTKASFKKRKRASDSFNSSEENASGDDISTDSEELYAQPLAKLLQSTTSLMQTTIPTSSGRKKLRPEVIDIQRNKDVGGLQPVSPYPFPHHLPSQLTISHASSHR